MSKNYAIIIHFVLPLTTFYRSGAHRSDVYKWDAFVTSWKFYNRAWQPQRHDRQPETSGTLWIHRGALTNQRCSLATGCGITRTVSFQMVILLQTELRPWQTRWWVRFPGICILRFLGFECHCQFIEYSRTISAYYDTSVVSNRRLSIVYNCGIINDKIRGLASLI